MYSPDLDSLIYLFEKKLAFIFYTISKNIESTESKPGEN